MSVFEQWQAGCTHRWHTNSDPRLRGSYDRVDGHSARVAILALGLFPDLPRTTLIECLYHDLGENWTGDLPWTLKQENPAIKRAIDSVESWHRGNIGAVGFAIGDEQKRILKMCDWLDAFLWVSQHSPKLLKRADWMDQTRACRQMAESLGVNEEVNRLIRESSA